MDTVYRYGSKGVLRIYYYMLEDVRGGRKLKRYAVRKYKKWECSDCICPQGRISGHVRRGIQESGRNDGNLKDVGKGHEDVATSHCFTSSILIHFGN